MGVEHENVRTPAKKSELRHRRRTRRALGLYNALVYGNIVLNWCWDLSYSFAYVARIPPKSKCLLTTPRVNNNNAQVYNIRSRPQHTATPSDTIPAVFPPNFWPRLPGPIRRNPRAASVRKWRVHIAPVPVRNNNNTISYVTILNARPSASPPRRRFEN